MAIIHNPAEVLFDVAVLGIWNCPRKPGEAYNRLPEWKKEILRQLKSEDIADIRLDAIWGTCK